jgi:hypothetical protein
MNPSAALDLRDIHAAPAPPFWPPAPGWWLLAVIVLIALVVLATWAWRRYRRYRYERQILLEVERLSDCYSDDNISCFITDISTLLRRVAIRRYSRAEVASLTGADWLRFLDATGGAGRFANGVGQILETGPYQPVLNDVPAEELLSLARRWISKNLTVAA